MKLFKAFKTKKQKLPIDVSDQMFNDLRVISRYLNSGRLEGISLKILPEDLVPKEYHDVFTKYLLMCMSKLYYLEHRGEKK